MSRGKLLVRLAKYFDISESNYQQILEHLPEDTPTEKVYHYLQNVSIAATKTNMENIDPYEFIDDKIDDINNPNCTVSKPDAVYEFSPVNKQLFEKNALNIPEHNIDSYQKNQNRNIKSDDNIINTNNSTQKQNLTHECLYLECQKINIEPHNIINTNDSIQNKHFTHEHYLTKKINSENTSTKTNMENIDPYEFIDDKIHNINNLNSTESKLDEQLFEKNDLNKQELNIKSYQEDQNTNTKSDNDIINTNNSIQNENFTHEHSLAKNINSENTLNDVTNILKIPAVHDSYYPFLESNKGVETTNSTTTLNKIIILEDVLLSQPVTYDLLTKERFLNTDNESKIVKEVNIKPSDFEHNSSQMSNCSLSDTDYLPPTTDSDSSSSSFEESSDDVDFLSVKNNTKENNPMPTRDITFPLNEVMRESHIPDGKNLCPICFEDVGHFSRHLFRKHCGEESVKTILKLPLKSVERRTAIISLRKKGNFVQNQQKSILKVVRKPNKKVCHMNSLEKNGNLFDNNEYFPCVHCLGYYKKSYLWRHKKHCKSKNQCGETNSTKIQHLSNAQTFLVSTGLLGNFVQKSRLKEEVLNIMRPDNISLTAKSDPLICLYGESYLNKHKRKQMNIVVSNKMREIARLKLALQKMTTITNLIDILKPEMYNHIVAASKIICGFNAETKTFKASSLALHLGTNLKFLCDVARKAIIIKDPLFPMLEKEQSEQKRKEISDLREIIACHWCNDVSSLANKVLNQSKYEKPKLLPVTEDIHLFKNYVTTQADIAFENITNCIDISQNYKLLAECTLCMVLVFNRKRIGEVQFLDIDSYTRNLSVVTQEECLSALTEFEKTMCSTFKRVLVFGKGSKPVPILLTSQMQTFIETLLKIRKTTTIVPQSNKYIFANPGSDRWMSAASILRKFAHKCGAKNPELLTSTRFRKQIATILQLMSFQKDEMEQIARFMGHTEKTHLEFYRLTEDVYQTAKVAKVLLLLNAGKGKELKGKNLAEIEIREDVLEYDEKELTKDQNEESEEICDKEKEITEDESLEQWEPFEESPQEDSQLPNKKPKISKAVSSNGKKQCRKSWSQKEKNLVLKFFAKHIKKSIAPKKEECLNFIKENLNLFNENDWVRIKTLVYNTYRQK